MNYTRIYGFFFPFLEDIVRFMHSDKKLCCLMFSRASKSQSVKINRVSDLDLEWKNYTNIKALNIGHLNHI